MKPKAWTMRHTLLAKTASEGELESYYHSLQQEYSRLPWWRWLRAFHLEKQIADAELGRNIFNLGYSRGLHDAFMRGKK